VALKATCFAEGSSTLEQAGHIDAATLAIVRVHITNVAANFHKLVRKPLMNSFILSHTSLVLLPFRPAQSASLVFKPTKAWKFELECRRWRLTANRLIDNARVGLDAPRNRLLSEHCRFSPIDFPPPSWSALAFVNSWVFSIGEASQR
jgi:hypothetical protein